MRQSLSYFDQVVLAVTWGLQVGYGRLGGDRCAREAV
jgi:hypothetical protein